MEMAGIGRHFGFDEMDGIPALWDEVGQRPACQSASVMYGISTIPPDGRMESGFGYMVAVEVAGGAEAPADLTPKSIPANRYAIFDYRGHVDGISSAVDSIMGRWLPESGYRLATDEPESVMLIERYGDEFDPGTASGKIELWLPIA
jgi:AraC family transcriptional regulator